MLSESICATNRIITPEIFGGHVGVTYSLYRTTFLATKRGCWVTRVDSFRCTNPHSWVTVTTSVLFRYPRWAMRTPSLSSFWSGGNVPQRCNTCESSNVCIRKVRVLRVFCINDGKNESTEVKEPSFCTQRHRFMLSFRVYMSTELKSHEKSQTPKVVYFTKFQ